MDIRLFLNRTTILGSLIFAGILILFTLILIGWTSPRFSPEVGFAPADLTMIPAPTHTPAATVTPTQDPLASPTPDPNTLHLNGYAQITGTGGDGLRIRSAPSLNGETVFLGGESEVFLIQDGPQSADGYVWWYVVASYDINRAGWVVENYLAVVPEP